MMCKTSKNTCVHGKGCTHLQALQQLVLREGIEEAVVGPLDFGPLALVLASTRLPVSAAPVIRLRQQRVHPRHHLRDNLRAPEVSCHLMSCHIHHCALSCPGLPVALSFVTQLQK